MGKIVRRLQACSYKQTELDRINERLHVFRIKQAEGMLEDGDVAEIKELHNRKMDILRDFDHE